MTKNFFVQNIESPINERSVVLILFSGGIDSPFLGR